MSLEEEQEVSEKEKAKRREKAKQDKARADEGERKVLAASVQCIRLAEAESKALPWLRSARLAKPEEDARGVDVVVESNEGTLWLQVKSGPMAAKLFEARGLDHVRVVIHHDDASVTRERTMIAICELYARRCRLNHPEHEVSSIIPTFTEGLDPRDEE